METNQNGRSPLRLRARKPAGGFHFMPVSGLLNAWAAMESGEITLYDLRVWLACHEMVARRCCMDETVEPSYGESEVLKLVGSGRECKARKSVRRLQEAGLLEWSKQRVNVDMGQRPIEAWVEAKVKNVRRKIPVPRRMLRYMAGCRSRVMIATLLGHLVRCLYYRKGCCVSGGRCKASWIADVFGVDIRGVKRARKELVKMGWLVPGRASQQALNRWGMQVIIRVQRTDEQAGHGTNPPSPQTADVTNLPPPISNRKLSTRSMNQKPGGTAGDEVDFGKRKRVALNRIRLEDLREPRCLDGLYRQAAAGGLVRESPANRLQWFAAAEHAMEAGDRNPCGLFVAMYRRGLWHHITQAQEDLARVKLKKLDFGEESWLPGQGRGFVPNYEEIAA